MNKNRDEKFIKEFQDNFKKLSYDRNINPFQSLTRQDIEEHYSDLLDKYTVPFLSFLNTEHLYLSKLFPNVKFEIMARIKSKRSLADKIDNPKKHEAWDFCANKVIIHGVELTAEEYVKLKEQLKNTKKLTEELENLTQGELVLPQDLVIDNTANDELTDAGIADVGNENIGDGNGTNGIGDISNENRIFVANDEEILTYYCYEFEKALSKCGFLYNLKNNRDDYIKNPKPSGYMSIHNTGMVYIPKGTLIGADQDDIIFPVETQLKTGRMRWMEHEGPAKHSGYKQNREEELKEILDPKLSAEERRNVATTYLPLYMESYIENGRVKFKKQNLKDRFRYFYGSAMKNLEGKDEMLCNLLGLEIPNESKSQELEER